MNFKTNESLKVFDIQKKQCCDYVKGFHKINAFKKSFVRDFGQIIAYHATKMDSHELRNLRREGVKVASKILLYQKALSRFISATDSTCVKEKIKSEIDSHFESFSPLGKPEINFGIDKPSLLKESYHDLLFGPETLLPLAHKMEDKFPISFRKRMVDFGNSYLIKVQIPVKQVNKIWIGGIFEYLINGFPETSLVYYKSLPANAIIKIEKIPTPIDRYGVLLGSTIR